ncbi:hypothetical protein ADL28_37730 [Streptomyces violaceusniger]|nr:hypothetical protein ADL28_37730 [Streptomyces violaceusniger]QTI90676.1 hypothetical protein AS97_41605 [Streptomyces sp. AgN23]RSS42679.1 hypothetical protein EF902_20080 [Streptomyces sp. WAC05858]
MRVQKPGVEWIGGSVFGVLLDAEATGGQLTVGRFDVSAGEAPPFHVGGLEKMFRHAGRDPRKPRPEGFEIPPQLLAEAAEPSGNAVLGPPR